jgi:hypothetical protein
MLYFLAFIESLCGIISCVDQAKIHKFLEKTKKRKNLKDKISEGESGAAIYEGEKLTKEQEKLRKKVTTLIKKQKVQQVRRIVKGHDDSRPWGQEEHVKVCDISCCKYSHIEVPFFSAFPLMLIYPRLALA